MQKRVASGLLAAVTAVTSTVVGMMWPTLDPAYGVPVLVGCGILFVVALAIWFWPRSDDGSGGTTQTTHGPHSPNIGSVGGNVTFVHGVQDATQHPKSPYGSGHSPRATEQAAEYVARHLRMAEAYSPGLETLGASPKPDMNLTELLVRVYKRLGGAPKKQPERDDFIRKIDFLIIDEITENGLHVWGRYGDRAREPISAYSLKRGKLNHRKDTFAVPSIDSGPMVFRELRFNRDEVDQIWPRQ